MPTSQTTDAMNAWLTQVGLNATPVSTAGDILRISVPVYRAKQLFDADFGVYTHLETDEEVIRTMSYSIPDSLEGHLDFIYPTVSLVFSVDGDFPVALTGH